MTSKPRTGTGSPPAFEWESCPLPEAQRRINDLEELLGRARSIVNRRLSVIPKKWKCWSQSSDAHKVIPAADYEIVLAQCRGEVPDGRHLHRDDGYVGLDGERRSIVICSHTCFLAYQQATQRLRAQRAGVSTMPAPIPLAQQTVMTKSAFQDEDDTA